MRRRDVFGIAVCLALVCQGAGAETDELEPLILSQGFDINELLKGGNGAQPERQTPQPVRPPGAADVTGVLRDAPRPAPLRQESAVAAALPVSPFAANALVGVWTGREAVCSGREILFRARGDGYAGEAVNVDPVDGYRVLTRIAAEPEAILEGDPYPGDGQAFFSYARRYAARVTRLDPDGNVLDLVDGWPVTLLVAREAGGDRLILRFAEPVTYCTYSRSGT